MRDIRTHKTNVCNEFVTVTAEDGPGPGGASHRYRLSVTNDKVIVPDTVLNFQNGPIGEVGTNGITGEALLAVVIDRLEGFQRGPYASGYNATALTACQLALDILKLRTQERESRGVEGTHNR